MPLKARGRKRPNASSKAVDAREVVNSLRRLFRAIHQYSKALQKRVGLSSPQVWALNLLGAEPGLSLGELSERMLAHPSTVSGIVDRLEARQVVLRAVDERDRRGIRLSLTPFGRRLLRKSPPPIQKALWEALKGMDASRLQQLRSSLEIITRRTEARHVRAPFFDLAP